MRLAVKTANISTFRIKSSGTAKAMYQRGRPLGSVRGNPSWQTLLELWVGTHVDSGKQEPVGEMNLGSQNYTLKSVENEKTNHPRSAVLEEILI